MDTYKTAAPIIVLATIIGLSAGIWVNQDSVNLDFNSLEVPDIPRLGNTAEPLESENNSIGALDSAHEHALFHVVVNGSEKDFTADRFQMNSAYVHLENNKSEIVHKHATGITWKMFFQTIRLSTSRNNSELCLKIYDSKRCGKGSVVLNGEFNASLDQEISQGDNLLIILDTEDWKKLSENYMMEELPEDYKPQKRARGKKI